MDKIIKIINSVASNNRVLMVECLIEFASDEFTSINECLELATLTKKELRMNLVNLLEYYLRIDK